MTTAFLRDRTGITIPLDVGRWRGEPDAVEWAMLETLPDPVLDIGCGPGRVAGALAARGRRALGIDSSPAAVLEATTRGATVLCRSVFDALPGERRWGSAVLLDGSIGIGGDPVALVSRVAQLLRGGGHLLVEVDPPGSTSGELLVRVERDQRTCPGAWFPWARVGADTLAATVEASDLLLVDIDTAGDRWFGRAIKP